MAEDEDRDVKLPAPYRPVDLAPQAPAGTISSHVSRYRADRDAKTIAAHNRRLASYKSGVDLASETADSLTRLKRAQGRLHDIDGILAEDQARRDYERNLAAVNRQTRLARAQLEGARAKHDGESFAEIAPLLKNAGKHDIEAGNWEGLAKVRMAEDAYARRWGDQPTEIPSVDGVDQTSQADPAIAIVQDQIAKAEARGEDTSNLYAALGRLTAQLKKQP